MSNKISQLSKILASAVAVVSMSSTSLDATAQETPDIDNQNDKTSSMMLAQISDEHTAQAWERARERAEAQKRKPLSEVRLNPRAMNSSPHELMLPDTNNSDQYINKPFYEVTKAFREGRVEFHLIYTVPLFPGKGVDIDTLTALQKERLTSLERGWSSRVGNVMEAMNALGNSLMKEGHDRGVIIDKIWIVQNNNSDFKTGTLYFKVGDRQMQEVPGRNPREYAEALMAEFARDGHLIPNSEYAKNHVGYVEMQSGSSKSGSGSGSASGSGDQGGSGDEGKTGGTTEIEPPPQVIASL